MSILTELKTYNMKTMKDGYYTEPHTSNKIAIINNEAFYVSSLNLITNERVTFASYIVEKWDYIPFNGL